MLYLVDDGYLQPTCCCCVQLRGQPILWRDDEGSLQTRRCIAFAPFAGNANHGLPHTSSRHDRYGARLLQAHGPGMRKDRNAAISFLLPNGAPPRSFRSDQEFVGREPSSRSAHCAVPARPYVQDSIATGIEFGFLDG